MKKTILMAAVLTSLTGLIGSAAFAQDAAAPQTGTVTTADAGDATLPPAGRGGAMGHAMRGGMRGPMEALPDFATLDTNGDGEISLDEVKAAAEARFAAADTNGDGALSQDELAAQILKRMQEMAANGAARMIENLDKNGDGVLQPDEMQARGGDILDRMFARIDTNNDGQISQAEYDAFQQRIADRVAQGGEHGHDHGGRRTHGN